MSRAKKRIPMWFRRAFKGLRLQSWPTVLWGAPRIRGTRLSAECIAGRFAAGDEIEQMADEHNVHRRAIEDCIRFGLRVSEWRDLDLGNYKKENIG